MKHPLTILLALLLLTSCKLTKEERRLNRDSRIIERAVLRSPELKRIDTIHTIIPTQSVHGWSELSISPEFDSKLDSILNTKPVDQSAPQIPKYTDDHVEQLIKEVPKYMVIDSVHFDNDTLSGSIWVDSGKVKYNIRTVPIPVATPCPTIQPVRFEPTAKESQRTDRWRTIALVFIGISVVLGLTHWVRS